MMITNSPTKPPFVVIGDFKPGKGNYFASIIAQGILDAIEHLNLKPLTDLIHGPQTTSIWSSKWLHAEVRRFAQPNGQGASWHQDGDLAEGSKMDHAEVVWSSKTPTEFCYEIGGTVWRPKPFEIVIARNLAGFHRTPPDAPKPPERRWFFRQRVAVDSVPGYVGLP